MHLCQDEAQKLLRYDQKFFYGDLIMLSPLWPSLKQVKGCWRNMDLQFDLLELCVISENKILHLG